MVDFSEQNTTNLSQLMNQEQNRRAALAATNIDTETKKNIYATQVMSAAASTGSQDAYNQGLAHLQQNGIDTSNWARDVQTGAQQAQAGRLAQSPLGALLNAGTRMDANGLKAAEVAGSVGGAQEMFPGQSANNVNGLMNGLRLQNQGQARTAPPSPQATPNIQSSSGSVSPALNALSDPIQQRYSELRAGAIQHGMDPSSYPETLDPKMREKFIREHNDALKEQTGNVGNGFVPPAPVPGDTAAMTKQKNEIAFEAWKANPVNVAEAEKAKAMGAAAGEEGKMLDIMKSGLPTMLGRFQSMREAAPNASYGLGVNNLGEGLYSSFANSQLGDIKTANANAELKQKASQNILGELGPQLAQAGVRGNKFLESIAAQASGIDLSSRPETKVNLINGLEDTYIKNLKSVANQVRLKGGSAPTDIEIDKAVKEYKNSLSKPSPQNSVVKFLGFE